jgi:hypothetical protein
VIGNPLARAPHAEPSNGHHKIYRSTVEVASKAIVRTVTLVLWVVPDAPTRARLLVVRMRTWCPKLMTVRTVLDSQRIKQPWHISTLTSNRRRAHVAFFFPPFGA